VRVLALCFLASASPSLAGTIAGRVEVLDKGRPLADHSDVVVYVDGVKAAPRPADATVRMKNKSFTPRVVAVPVGGTVHFPNDDNILHNAFSVSRPNAFDLKLYKRPKSGSYTFLQPGVVRVYCNIHPQMSAIVVVRDNPFFAMAAPDGSFALEGVPAGRHTVRAWHDRGGETQAVVTVGEHGKAATKLSLDTSSYKRVQHKRKDGSSYGAIERY
jgi:plastocyanin